MFDVVCLNVCSSLRWVHQESASGGCCMVVGEATFLEHGTYACFPGLPKCLDS